MGFGIRPLALLQRGYQWNLVVNNDTDQCTQRSTNCKTDLTKYWAALVADWTDCLIRAERSCGLDTRPGHTEVLINLCFIAKRSSFYGIE